MSTFEITTNAGPLGASLRNFPALIERYLKPALDDSAQEIARKAKRNVRENQSMAYSHLIKTIGSAIYGGGLEAVISAGTNYAHYVEEGTRGGGYPNQQTILDWMNKKGIRPNNPQTSQTELAYLIARTIVFHGTHAKPFMKPAYELEKTPTINRLNEAIRQAIREIH
jgi:hypothetical protein